MCSLITGTESQIAHVGFRTDVEVTTTEIIVYSELVDLFMLYEHWQRVFVACGWGYYGKSSLGAGIIAALVRCLCCSYLHHGAAKNA